MMLEEKYPVLVKSTNLLNLKSMGPNCFDTIKRNRETTKRHHFWESIHCRSMESLDRLYIETKNLVNDDEGTDIDAELIEDEQAEVPVRELLLINSENLASLIVSLKDSLRNPSPAITPTQQEQAEDDTTDDVGLMSRKKQRVEPKPSIVEQLSRTAETEPIIQTAPEVTATIQENVIPGFFEMSFSETTTRSGLEISSGVRFDVGGSSSGGMSEQ
ncbi:hypothetical protein Hanom_Chr14g01278011 [Helianthus anomalus]